MIVKYLKRKYDLMEKADDLFPTGKNDKIDIFIVEFENLIDDLIIDLENLEDIVKSYED